MEPARDAGTAGGRRAGAAHRPGATLTLYAVRELLIPTAFALGGFSLLVLTTDLLGWANLVVNRGLGAAAVGWIALFDAVPTVARALPLAVLVGSLTGLGRMGADREILALEAGGVSPSSLLLPVGLFAGAAAALGLAISTQAAPRAARGLDETIRELAREHPGAALRPGSVQEFGAWRLRAEEVSPGGEGLRGVMLWMPDVGDTLFARSGTLRGREGRPVLSLEEGALLQQDPVEGRAREIRFATFESRLPRGAEQELRLSDWLETASQAELAAAAGGGGPRARAARVAWHRRLAQPLAAAAFGLLAVPVFLQRARPASRSAGAALGLALTVAYYGLVQLEDGLVRGGWLPVPLAVWLPDLALVAAAGALLARAALRGPGEGRGGRSTAAGGADDGSVRTHRFALQRYVLSRFAALALGAFLVLGLAYLAVDVLDNLKWFAKYEAHLDEIFRYYAARTPVLASRVVPMALLVASALAVSLLSADGELTGMRACGIAAGRALLPILGLCAVLAAGYHGLHNELVPRASERASHLKRVEIKDRRAGGQPGRGRLWRRTGREVTVADEFDPLMGVAHGVTLYQLDEAGLPLGRTDAVEARHVGSGLWRLLDPVRVERTTEGPVRVPVAPFAELGEELPAEVETAHLSPAQLRAEIRMVEEGGYSAVPYRVDLHAKWAAPWACLVLPALALFFAAGGPPYPSPVQTLVWSAAVAVGHLLLVSFASSLGYGGMVPPVVAGWAPVGILAVVAMGLAVRLQRSGQGL